MLSPALRDMAQVMLWELERERLDVTLAPSRLPEIARRGGKIRIINGTNPAWYRDFCRDYAPSGRTHPRQKKKPDTYIKRRHTLRALNELATGRCETEYAHRLLPYVREQHRELCQRYGVPCCD